MGVMLRLYLACALVSAWLVLLLVGIVFGGAVHLLLAAALAAFPWPAVRRSGDRGSDSISRRASSPPDS